MDEERNDVAYWTTYKGLGFCKKRLPSSEAEMALRFADRWGMVAAMPDGEDSAGRSRVRLATPEEVVTRSMEVAELMFKAFEEKGWLLRIPDEVFESMDKKSFD